MYHAASYKRIVERLEWLDDKGQVVMVEHYDQYGRKIAVTTCGDQGQYLVTTYFEGDTERLTEITKQGIDLDLGPSTHADFQESLRLLCLLSRVSWF